jgi:hypothetical protein
MATLLKTTLKLVLFSFNLSFHAFEGLN